MNDCLQKLKAGASAQTFRKIAQLLSSSLCCSELSQPSQLLFNEFVKADV